MDQQPDQDRSGSPERDSLNTDLADAFGELVEQMIERFEGLARQFSMPAFAVKALHMLSTPMAMKELGQKFHCDPSFVTSIADMLDSRGLGKRETDTKDRRIKNLTLTKAGLEMRACVEREMLKIMPWTQALEADEQETLLRLVRKMVKAAQDQTSTTDTDRPVVAGDTARGVSQEPSQAATSGR